MFHCLHRMNSSLSMRDLSIWNTDNVSSTNRGNWLWPVHRYRTNFWCACRLHVAWLPDCQLLLPLILVRISGPRTGLLAWLQARPLHEDCPAGDACCPGAFRYITYRALGGFRYLTYRNRETLCYMSWAIFLPKPSRTKSWSNELVPTISNRVLHQLKCKHFGSM